MTLRISYMGSELHGARADLARQAAEKHFASAQVTPHLAARAAFVQEGEQEEVSLLEGEWAEAWRCARFAVANALDIDPEHVDVDLDLGADGH